MEDRVVKNYFSSTFGVELSPEESDRLIFCKPRFIPVDRFIVSFAVKGLSGGVFDGIRGVVFADPSVQLEEYCGLSVIETSSPEESFWRAHRKLRLEVIKQLQASEIAETALIHPTASIADTGVFIGENVEVGPNAVICSGVHLSKNVSVGAGCVIGADALESGKLSGSVAEPHAGVVLIEEGVVLQSLVSVSKALFFGDRTVIGGKTLVGDHVHIAHGVSIGAESILAAGSLVCGNAHLGQRVWVGPKVVVTNRVNIGSNARLHLGSNVINSVGSDCEVCSIPALDKKHVVKILK